MIANPASTSGEVTRIGGDADIADLASVWAILNVLDRAGNGESVEPTKSRQAFIDRLEAQGLSEVELFEHIAKAVDERDWGALGLPDPEN